MIHEIQKFKGPCQTVKQSPNTMRLDCLPLHSHHKQSNLLSTITNSVRTFQTPSETLTTICLDCLALNSHCSPIQEWQKFCVPSSYCESVMSTVHLSQYFTWRTCSYKQGSRRGTLWNPDLPTPNRLEVSIWRAESQAVPVRILNLVYYESKSDTDASS